MKYKLAAIICLIIPPSKIKIKNYILRTFGWTIDKAYKKYAKVKSKKSIEKICA